jgi:hypothetical protein
VQTARREQGLHRTALWGPCPSMRSVHDGMADLFGDTEQEAGEGKGGDVMVELVPVPVLRIGGQ